MKGVMLDDGSKKTIRQSEDYLRKRDGRALSSECGVWSCYCGLERSLYLYPVAVDPRSRVEQRIPAYSFSCTCGVRDYGWRVYCKCGASEPFSDTRRGVIEAWNKSFIEKEDKQCQK